MKKAIKKVNTCLSIYLTPEECEDLHKRMLATTCRSKSEFVRKVLFNKPVRVLIRNESIDDMIEELISLRRELANLLNKSPPTERERLALQSIVAQIKEKINQLADHVCKSKL
jgi:hypothetical protein